MMLQFLLFLNRFNNAGFFKKPLYSSDFGLQLGNLEMDIQPISRISSDGIYWLLTIPHRHSFFCWLKGHHALDKKNLFPCTFLYPASSHFPCGSIKIQRNRRNPNNQEIDVFFSIASWVYNIQIHLSVINFPAPSRKVWPARPLQIVADHLPALQPESDGGQHAGGQIASKTLGLFRNFKVNGWTYIYLYDFSEVLVQWLFFSATPLLFCTNKRFEKFRGVRKGSSSKHWVVQALSFWAPPCLSHQLIHHWLDVFSFQQPPKKLRQLIREITHVFGEFLLVCCVFFLQMIFPPC